MSSLLYQLSYNLVKYADKGFAPISTDHESVMLLLHQSALGLFRLINYLGRKGIEPSTAKGY